MKKLLFLFFIAFISNQTLANAPFTKDKVNKIIFHDFGVILIYLENGVKTNEQCTNKSAIVLQKEKHFYQEMYSALLSAYHSGTEVTGWVNGCDSTFNLPILSRLDLLPKT